MLVAYPKDEFQRATTAMAIRAGRLAALLWAVLSAIAYAVLRFLMAGPVRRLEQLEALAAGGDAAPAATAGEATQTRAGLRLLGDELDQLETNLREAGLTYTAAVAALTPLTGTGGGGTRRAAEAVDGAGQSGSVLVEQAPGGSLARTIVRRLAPLAALLIIAGALILGAITVRDVNRSVEPELAARTSLIGTVVSENVQRAVRAGVPLDHLVGAEQFFGAMLARLPEVAYIAVATGRIVLEAGDRIDPYLAPPRARKEVRSHPIMHEGEEIAYVIIDIDPAFITDRFLEVFLDLGVVILVTVLIAFEVMILLTSRSLTAALDRLQRIAALQAAGDFSKRVPGTARRGVDRIVARLGERSESLNALFATAWARAATAPDAERRRLTLEAVAARFRLSLEGPALLRFPYFTDIRLALFLFAAADQLPLSFLPLYTRAAENPWAGLDESVVISLPLAGYLLAILLASPFVRPLTAQFGHRRLLLLAALPTLAAHIGLYLASGVPEIVLYRTLTGLGYAIATLACQDYVLDIVPRDQRDRSLGMFSTVLFGGIFCGTALGGVLADRIGQPAVFLVSGGLIVASAALIARFLSPLDAGAGRTAARYGLPTIWAPLRDRTFAALVLGIAIPAGVLLQAFVAYLVALTLDDLDASTADIGRTLMLYFLAIALVGPLAGRAAEAWAPVSAIASTGAFLSGASLLPAAFWPSQLTLAGAVLGAGIGHGMTRGAQVSMAMAIAETGLARLGPNAVLGVLRTLERAGSIVGLLPIALLAGVAGYPDATLAVAVWVLAGAALYTLATLNLGEGSRDAAAAPSGRDFARDRP
ncbi:MAG TPA: MFS transporter [Geminicoccaceae bacterium]